MSKLKELTWTKVSKVTTMYPGVKGEAVRCELSLETSLGKVALRRFKGQDSKTRQRAYDFCILVEKEIEKIIEGNQYA